jgi:SnoaL-like protein
MTDLTDRSAAEVFEDHLRLASEGDFEGDLARNVSEDIVALTPRGVFRGHGGVRELARQLMDEIPNGEWRYGAQLVEGRIAFLEWTVETGPFRVPDGADSFVIEDGKIQAQTIHYTVTDPDGNVVIRPDGTRP